MLARIKCGGEERLVELSLKQRQQRLLYVTEKRASLDERVTWREFIEETKSTPQDAEVPAKVRIVRRYGID